MAKKQRFALTIGRINDRDLFDRIIVEIKGKDGPADGRAYFESVNKRWIIDCDPYDGLLGRKGITVESLEDDYKPIPNPPRDRR